MPEPRSLIVRLLDTPDIARVVPRLAPELLHRLVDRCGLEACADLVALATPRQLRRLLDIDLWRAPVPGQDERLDAARFGEWLEALLQLGAAAAGDRLAAMDFDVVAGGFASHVAVFDGGVVFGYTKLDGERVSARTSAAAACEIGGFNIEERRTAVWETIVELLVELHAERPAFFQRLMRACVTLSDGARERDGLDDLLDGRGQQLADLAADRRVRRDRQGFVSPAEGRAFLRTARAVRLDAPRPSLDPTASHYLRDQTRVPSPADQPALDAQPGDDPEPMAAVIEILAEAGVVTPPRALLPGPAGEIELAQFTTFAESHAPAQEELAFLTNAVLAGCGVSGRALTPEQASDLVAATCNLGLENWPQTWPARDLVTAFQIGFSLLHQDLCCHAAQVLAEAIGDLRCPDPELQWGLQRLRHELTRHLRAGEPWRAEPALDAILPLDPIAWAVLVALIAECPSLHAALHATGLRVDPSAVTFVCCNAEIASARAYLATLATRLAG